MFLKFNITSSDLLLNKKFTWGENKEKSFLNDIDQILKKVPIQHITSSEFFYDSTFYINKTWIHCAGIALLFQTNILLYYNDSLSFFCANSTNQACIAMLFV